MGEPKLSHRRARKVRAGKPPGKKLVPVRREPGGRRVAWAPELLALLGRMADLKVANLAGVDIQTVVRERRRRGIASFLPHWRHDWTAEEIALLGTASDSEVGAAVGVSRVVVRRKRHLLGIPSFHPRPHEPVGGLSWGPEDLALLGTMTDREVARRLGISIAAVNHKRRLLKIPAFRPATPMYRWTPATLSLLGRVPDPEVARRSGISGHAVRRKRRQLGIGSYVDNGVVVPSAALRELMPLSTSEVTRRTGVCRKTIRRLRAVMGAGGDRKRGRGSGEATLPGRRARRAR